MALTTQFFLRADIEVSEVESVFKGTEIDKLTNHLDQEIISSLRRCDADVVRRVL